MTLANMGLRVVSCRNPLTFFCILLLPSSGTVQRMTMIGGGGGFTHRVLCTWQLLGCGVKWPWFAMGGPILA